MTSWSELILVKKCQEEVNTQNDKWTSPWDRSHCHCSLPHWAEKTLSLCLKHDDEALRAKASPCTLFSWPQADLAGGCVLLMCDMISIQWGCQLCNQSQLSLLHRRSVCSWSSDVTNYFFSDLDSLRGGVDTSLFRVIALNGWQLLGQYMCVVNVPPSSKNVS